MDIGVIVVVGGWGDLITFWNLNACKLYSRIYDWELIFNAPEKMNASSTPFLLTLTW